jgi:hypothetical protein
MMFIGLSAMTGTKAIAVKRASLRHIHKPATPPVSGTNRCLLAAVYKPPQNVWSNTDITELLCFRNKSILEGDLNAKRPA